MFWQVLTSGTVRDNIVDFFNFRFGSLRPLINRHGSNSSHAKEATALLGKETREYQEKIRLTDRYRILQSRRTVSVISTIYWYQSGEMCNRVSF